MSSKLILFITIHLAAFIYFVELLRRAYIRSKEYGLKENSNTLPFGLIRLRHVIALFVLTYIIWIIGSIFLYFYFIDPSLAESGQGVRIFNLNF
jgi:hypothetical protein